MPDRELELTLEAACTRVDRLIAERDKKLTADSQWMDSNLPFEKFSIDQTQGLAAKILQRNQVLFSVGYIEQTEFRYADIEAFIRQRFPESNQGAVLNVAHAMSELAGDESGILKRTPKGDGYMLKSPVFRTCLRAMLWCQADSEVVERVAITFP